MHWKSLGPHRLTPLRMTGAGGFGVQHGDSAPIVIFVRSTETQGVYHEAQGKPGSTSADVAADDER
jgi:hypothetical protein